MQLVLNEWLLEWLQPSSGWATTALLFLERVRVNRDLILIRRQSPFTTKLRTFSKRLEKDTRSPFRILHRLLLDSSVVRLVEEHQIQQPSPELAAACPAEDLYLAELADSFAPATLVTTDRKLHSALHGRFAFQVELAEPFLAAYPNPTR